MRSQAIDEQVERSLRDAAAGDAPDTHAEVITQSSRRRRFDIQFLQLLTDQLELKHVAPQTDAIARRTPTAVGGTLRRHRRRPGQLHSNCESRKKAITCPKRDSEVNRIIVLYVFADFQVAGVVRNVDPDSGCAGELCFLDSR